MLPGLYLRQVNRDERTASDAAGEQERPDGIPGTPVLAEVYGLHAAARDTTPEAIRAFVDARTSLGRQPTLTEVAETAAFLVSDRASALTGTIVKLSCGSIVD